MLKKQLLKISFFSVLFLPGAATFGFCAGTAGGVILKYLPGVRQNAMGAGGTALHKDFNSINYNPAVLSSINNFSVSALYDSSFSDAGIYYLGAGKKNGLMDIGITFLGFNGGDITINDSEEVNNAETLNAQSDYIASIIISKELSKVISLGLAGKYYSSTLLEQYSASAISSDAGIFFDTGLFEKGNICWVNRVYSEGLNIGVSIKNLGQGIKYRSHLAPQPIMFRAGMAYYLRFNNRHAVNVLSETLKDNESSIKNSLGLEYRVDNRFFLRMGYKFNYEIKNFTFGVGMQYNNIKFDYGMLLNSAINNNHQLMLSFEI